MHHWVKYCVNRCMKSEVIALTSFVMDGRTDGRTHWRLAFLCPPPNGFAMAGDKYIHWNMYINIIVNKWKCHITDYYYITNVRLWYRCDSKDISVCILIQFCTARCNLNYRLPMAEWVGCGDSLLVRKPGWPGAIVRRVFHLTDTRKLVRFSLLKYPSIPNSEIRSPCGEV